MVVFASYYAEATIVANFLQFVVTIAKEPHCANLYIYIDPTPYGPAFPKQRQSNVSRSYLLLQLVVPANVCSPPSTAAATNQPIPPTSKYSFPKNPVVTAY